MGWVQLVGASVVLCRRRKGPPDQGLGYATASKLLKKNIHSLECGFRAHFLFIRLWFSELGLRVPGTV